MLWRAAYIAVAATLGFVLCTHQDITANLQKLQFTSSATVLVAVTDAVAPNGTVNHCAVDVSSSHFPEAFFTSQQKKHGAFLIHIVIALYCFIIIAFVCNDYFLPSVDCICQDLNLSLDVAGATFMALATAMPELFVNIIGTFITESDLGVGTVVGSAVFNTLGVAACGGLATSMTIKLEVYPLLRDCIIYMVVVSILTIAMWDDKIFWYEAMVLIILYILYFTFMFCEKNIIKATRKMCNNENSLSTKSTPQEQDSRPSSKSSVYIPVYYHGEIIHPTDDQLSENLGADKNIETPNPHPSSADEGKMRMMSPHKEKLMCCWRVLTLPITIMLRFTIPDCKKSRKLYPVTFLMCVVWLGLNSYMVSWMITTVGNTFQISDSIMGITFLAVGGSMPEAVSAVINARLGIGSMSISNALGANTLDILLCLGLPWLVKTLLPASLNGGPINIISQGLAYNNTAQLACVTVFFFAASVNKYNLNRALGLICLILYFIFIVFTILVELNVIPINVTDVCG